MSGAPGGGRSRLDLCQRQPRVIEECSTRRRQFDTPDAAYQELSADLSFQIPQLPTERRLRRVQPVGGRERDAALLGDGHEITQVP
jgi:hypothetical protein